MILYLCRHPLDEKETILLIELGKDYGEYKEIPEERLAIFIVKEIKVNEFIDTLNSFNTEMHLSYIHSEDEIVK